MKCLVTGCPKLPCWMESNSHGSQEERRPAKNHLAENGDDERGGGDGSNME